jgi:hypothetical protein
MVGYDPMLILSNDLASELELVEAVAKGMSIGIQQNYQMIDYASRLLRRAGWVLISAPLLAGAAYVATKEIFWGDRGAIRLFPLVGALRAVLGAAVHMP